MTPRERVILTEAYWQFLENLKGPGTDTQAYDHIVARAQDVYRGPHGFIKVVEIALARMEGAK